MNDQIETTTEPKRGRVMRPVQTSGLLIQLNEKFDSDDDINKSLDIHAIWYIGENTLEERKAEKELRERAQERSKRKKERKKRTNGMKQTCTCDKNEGTSDLRMA
jgi:uncharacterized protein (DUF2225 family)